MKIHSDTLNASDIHACTKGQPYVYVFDCERAGSRSRKHAFNVYLAGSSPSMAQHQTADGYREHAATYDEWGWFLAYVFEADPNAIAGPYKGRDDFNAQTADKFTYWVTA